MPTAPYVTAAEFAAHPTYLDLDGLRVGSPDPAAQTAELVNVLLMASQWADNKCNQPLGAHQVVQNLRAGCDRQGNLQLPASDGPILSMTSVACGLTPGALTPVTTLTGAWVQSGRLALVPLGGSAARLGPGAGLFVRWTYTAGWVSTTLTVPASAGASTLTVADPTGILPGASYRIWEPGGEETVTVASSFVPPTVTAPPAATAVPLAAPTAFAHTAGAGWSGMPADMRLAVINYATALLMRPDTTAEDQFPNTQLASNTRRNDPRNGSGLVAEAARTLSSYGRVR